MHNVYGNDAAASQHHTVHFFSSCFVSFSASLWTQRLLQVVPIKNTESARFTSQHCISCMMGNHSLLYSFIQLQVVQFLLNPVTQQRKFLHNLTKILFTQQFVGLFPP